MIYIKKYWKNNFINKRKSVIEINYSKDLDYNKQRDNVILPLSTCGPTSMAMALLQAGYRDWIKDGEDPADTITKHLSTEEAYKRMYKEIGSRDTSWRPFNIHAVLTWGVNDLLNSNISTFRTDWNLRVILLNIIQRGGVVLSGDFVLPNGRELGHMVSLAGFRTRQETILSAKLPIDIELSKIVDFIIDDPYGNFTTGYISHLGMNTTFSIELFNETFRRRGNFDIKWGHLIKFK